MMLSIHPFPARMAPELARAVLAKLPSGSRVIDPMCGSGTVIRHAVEAGHDCVGRDIDPLAVLMTRAWTSKIATYRLAHDAAELIRRAQALKSEDVRVPWQDADTARFAEYWFAPTQHDALMRLASVIQGCRYRSRDLLTVALSRVIITKDRGASLARDVSHSRPHRVRDRNDFDVYDGFMQATRLIAKRLVPEAIRGLATVERGDARTLGNDEQESYDVAVTSPPYLNAIDYLRGHRLTLIWLGYSVGELRALRAQGTGAERIADQGAFDIEPFIRSLRERPLTDPYLGWIRRYSSDMTNTLGTLRAAVRPGGQIVIVVGNSLIRGAAVDNAGIIERCASGLDLELEQAKRRVIPARRRYLPPPRDGTPFALRMRTETVLTFRR